MKHIPNEDNNPFKSLADLILNNESIAVLATAVEKHEIFFWDRFGRFKKAEKNDKNLALELLANQYDWESKQDPFSQQNPLEVNYYHPLNLYGWAEGVIPNFDKIRSSLDEVNIPQRKSAETNSATTFLVLIASLLNKLNIGIDENGKVERGVAVELQKITEEYGVPISDDTVRNLLIKLPEAILSRKK